MKYKRIINPLVPKSRTNPTGTGKILSAADKDIAARYRRITERVLAWFDSVPWLAFNAEWAYQFPASRMDELRQILAEITTSELVGGQPLTFWFAEYEDDSARLGLAQASANLSAMSATYAATRPMYAVMATDAYRNRVAMAKQRSYTHFTGLSDALQADLAQVIAYGIQNGQNPRALAGVIRDRMGVSESRARMYAQSEIPGTLRDVTLAEGDDAAEALGIEIKYLWTSALIPTTRPWHGSRHGRIFSSEEIRDFYSRDGNRYNCFLPDTKVSGRFVGAVRSFYDGVVVKLVTRSGRSLTVTPNHPLMTDRGLIAATMLNKGDNLIGYSGEVGSGLFDGVCALNSDLANPTIEQVFSAASDVFKVINSRRAFVDFHGDGRLMDENIDVVHMDRMLMCAVNSDITKCLENFKLVSSDLSALASGGGDSFFNATLSSSDGIVSGGGSGGFDLAALSGGSGNLSLVPVVCLESEPGESVGKLLSSNASSFADGKDTLSGSVAIIKGGYSGDIALGCEFASIETLTSHPFGDRVTVNAKLISNLLDGLSGLVFIDEIIDINFVHYRGHVYDLQEESGLMVANGVIASNCYCAATAVLIEDGVPQLTQKLKATYVAEKTQWEQANG